MNTDDPIPLGNVDALPIASQLSQAIRAGLPLESGLRALAEQTRSRRVRQALLVLSQSLEQGIPLADALRASDAGLPPQLRALVEAGIEAGRLDSVMQYCIEQSQRATSLRQHIWLAISYPFFVMWFSSLICGAILLVIVPTFGKIFNDFGTELPGITVALMSVSSFLMMLGFLPWLILVLGGIGFWLIFVLTGFSNWGQRWATSIPLIGRAFRYAALTDFCQILAILAESGLAFPKALTFAGNASDDRWLNRKCKTVAHDIDLGSNPSQAAMMADLPSTLSQVFREASSTRTFAEALRGLADIYAAQSQVTAQLGNTFVAHLAVTFVIGFAGITVISLFLPLIKLLNDLS